MFDKHIGKSQQQVYVLFSVDGGQDCFESTIPSNQVFLASRKYHDGISMQISTELFAH